MRVMAGDGPVNAREMLDSGKLWRDGQGGALRHRFARDGFLLLRGLLNHELVLAARASALAELAELRPEVFSSSAPLSQGVAADGAKHLGLLGYQHIARGENVIVVIEAPELFSLARMLTEEQDIITTRFKWLRAVGNGEYTGVHTDRVFLGQGSPRLLTIWLPLGDVPVEQGALLVCRASHRLRPFAPLRATYGTSVVGVDGTRSGWLSSDGSTLCNAVGGYTHHESLAARPTGKYAVDWCTTNFKAGDAVVLAIDTFHMSATNCTDRIRVSCDTRWQPAKDARDPRLKAWMGPEQVVRYPAP